MNENSSKQVLLSVLGIAVLVIAVVGVSFAFFTYSREGTTNNTISTGSVVFQFTEGQAIRLTNQFPISDELGAGTTYASTGDLATLTFHAIGYDGSGKGITYTITAEEGEPVANKTARLHDSGIKLYLDDSRATGVQTNNFSATTGTAVGADGDLANGVVLGIGKITATSQATQQDDTYVLHMWISDSVVSIDATETAGDTDNVYTPAEFANLYYSLRLKMDAETTTTP